MSAPTLTRAAELLEARASELMLCSTDADGRWGEEHEAREDHDEMMRVAEELRLIVTVKQLADSLTPMQPATQEHAPRPLMDAVEAIIDAGHLDTEHLARLRAAWEAAGYLAEPAASEDTRLLDFLAAEHLDLQSFEIATGAGDGDIGWRTTQHHPGQPTERVASEIYHDDPRQALREAVERLARDPYCTGPIAKQAVQPSPNRERLVEAITKAILFAACGNAESWRDNTDLGEAALSAYEAAQPADVAQMPGEQASDAYEDALVRLVEKDGLREALSIVTASFVGLVMLAMEQAGHKPDGEIRIDGGESRDITIHAAKGGA